jgi:hypothetical protein
MARRAPPAHDLLENNTRGGVLCYAVAYEGDWMWGAGRWRCTDHRWLQRNRVSVSERHSPLLPGVRRGRCP